MGAAAGIVGGAVLGGISYLVQGKQQKIAAQKQQDAVDKAAADQKVIMDQQKAADAERKKKEESALQQGFARTALRRTAAAGPLPNAVPESAIGTVGNYANQKKLIGS